MRYKNIVDSEMKDKGNNDVKTKSDNGTADTCHLIMTSMTQVAMTSKIQVNDDIKGTNDSDIKDLIDKTDIVPGGLITCVENLHTIFITNARSLSYIHHNDNGQYIIDVFLCINELLISEGNR